MAKSKFVEEFQFSWSMRNPLKRFFRVIRKNPVKSVFAAGFIVVYYAIHELARYIMISYFGYNTRINWTWMPHVAMPPDLEYLARVIVPSSPYIFALLFMVALFFFRRSIYVKIISSVVLLNFTANVILFPLTWIMRTPNDFYLIFFLNRGWFFFMLAVWLMTIIFWILIMFDRTFSSVPGTINKVSEKTFS